MRVADEHHRKCLSKWLEPCLAEMRHTARAYGYALAVHGSLTFDIDIVCIPWIDEADSPESLVSALREACSRVTKMPTYFWGMPCENPEYSVGDDFLIAEGKRPDSDRPHGRRAWSWQLGGGAYVDCSVMPRTGGLN